MIEDERGAVVEARVGTGLNQVRGLRASKAIWMVGLFLLGLALRLPGLLFNGMLDLNEIMLIWGAEVRMYGLAAAFKNNYGLFSYALYGVFFALAEQMPRFWWAPYKLAEIYFETLVFIALYSLAPPRWKWWIFPFFWLNPWFILHGAWQGFWEGPHTLAACLAILAVRRFADERVAWFVVGLLLMTSAMFKPQGLAYFVVPLFLYLTVQLVRLWHPALLWFSAGVGVMFISVSASVVVLGGKITALVDNYLSAIQVMPHLCNGCVNIWRSVAVSLQQPFGLSGPTYALEFPGWFETPLHGLAALLTLALLVLVALKYPLFPQQPLKFADKNHRQGLTLWLAAAIELVQRPLAWVFRPPLATTTHDHPPYYVLLVVLALASLIVSQFGTRAHINHSYTALVLLIPLVVGQVGLRWVWSMMVAIQFYAHLATYHLGRPTVLPDYLRDPAPVQPLVDAMMAALATQPYELLIRIQARINNLISTRLPEEPIIAILAFIHFLGTLYLLRHFMRNQARQGLEAAWLPDESPRG